MLSGRATPSLQASTSGNHRDVHYKTIRQRTNINKENIYAIWHKDRGKSIQPSGNALDNSTDALRRPEMATYRQKRKPLNIKEK